MSVTNRRPGIAVSCLAALTLAGCAPSPEQSGPLGATADLPTGHPDVSADGLVASYDMSTRTSDGRLADLSGRELHGTVSGTESEASPMGEALVFAKASDRVALPSGAALDIDGPLSIAMSFRFDRSGQHQHMLACDDRFALWLTPADHVRFVNTLGDGAETTVPLSAGSWYSVVGVFRGTAGDPIDAGNVEIWVNGLKAESSVGSARLQGSPIWQDGELHGSDACYIGFESHQGEPTHQGLVFFGAIDEVRVFNRALGEAEIQLLAGAFDP